MAPRATWTGSVNFGLVNVPVKLYTAVADKETKFNMIHGKCGSRIQLKRVCASEGTEVPFDQIVKGFEIKKGEFVTVTPEELEAADPKGDKCIDIEDFVSIDDIDPIYFEKTYYLAPDKGALKPFQLLLAAMQNTQKVGIARVTLRSKQSLCCVRPMGNLLAVSLMNYADEIVAKDDFDMGTPQPAERELKMAEKLIEAQACAFSAEKYRDGHREKVLALIERKAAGETLTPAPVEKAAKAVDLASALEASIAAAAKKKPANDSDRKAA